MWLKCYRTRETFYFYCTKHDNIRNDLLNHILDNDIEKLKIICMDFERSKDLASYILEGLDNRIN